MIKKTNKPRDQALIASLFETGGRISEVLNLEKRHFRLEDDYIIVIGMMVEKRFKKIGEYKDKKGKVRWNTKISKAYRTFPILRSEPLSHILSDWIQERTKKLFRIGRIRAYQIITKIDPDVWCHWFRAQRASQLALEYGFSVHDLVEFFDWKTLSMAIHYSRMGWKGLAAKMVR